MQTSTWKKTVPRRVAFQIVVWRKKRWNMLKLSRPLRILCFYIQQGCVITCASLLVNMLIMLDILLYHNRSFCGMNKWIHKWRQCNDVRANPTLSNHMDKVDIIRCISKGIRIIGYTCIIIYNYNHIVPQLSEYIQ